MDEGLQAASCDSLSEKLQQESADESPQTNSQVYEAAQELPSGHTAQAVNAIHTGRHRVDSVTRSCPVCCHYHGAVDTVCLACGANLDDYFSMIVDEAANLDMQWQSSPWDGDVRKLQLNAVAHDSMDIQKQQNLSIECHVSPDSDYESDGGANGHIHCSATGDGICMYEDIVVEDL